MTSDVEVEPLKLNRKQRPKKVKTRTDHGTTYVHIPKKWVYELAMILGQEVMLEKSVSPHNPFAWTITIKPKPE